MCIMAWSLNLSKASSLFVLAQRVLLRFDTVAEILGSLLESMTKYSLLLIDSLVIFLILLEKLFLLIFRVLLYVLVRTMATEKLESDVFCLEYLNEKARGLRGAN